MSLIITNFKQEPQLDLETTEPDLILMKLNRDQTTRITAEVPVVLSTDEQNLSGYYSDYKYITDYIYAKFDTFTEPLLYRDFKQKDTGNAIFTECFKLKLDLVNYAQLENDPTLEEVPYLYFDVWLEYPFLWSVLTPSTKYIDDVKKGYYVAFNSSRNDDLKIDLDFQFKTANGENLQWEVVTDIPSTGNIEGTDISGGTTSGIYLYTKNDITYRIRQYRSPKLRIKVNRKLGISLLGTDSATNVTEVPNIFVKYKYKVPETIQMTHDDQNYSASNYFVSCPDPETGSYKYILNTGSEYLNKFALGSLIYVPSPSVSNVNYDPWFVSVVPGNEGTKTISRPSKGSLITEMPEIFVYRNKQIWNSKQNIVYFAYCFGNPASRTSYDAETLSYANFEQSTVPGENVLGTKNKRFYMKGKQEEIETAETLNFYATPSIMDDAGSVSSTSSFYYSVIPASFSFTEPAKIEVTDKKDIIYVNCTHTKDSTNANDYTETKSIAIGNTLFNIKVNDPEFSTSKIKIKQNLYFKYNTSGAGTTAIDSEEFDITSGFRFVQDGSNYSIEPYYNINLETSRKVPEQYGGEATIGVKLAWPYCIPVFNYNNLYNSEISLYYDDELIDSTNVNLCRRFTFTGPIEKQDSTQQTYKYSSFFISSQFIAYDWFYIIDNIQSKVFGSSAYEEMPIGSYDAGYNSNTLFDNIQIEKISGIDSGLTEIQKFQGSSPNHKVKRFFINYNRLDVDQTDNFNINIVVPGDSKVYKYAAVTVIKPKDSIFFLGADFDDSKLVFELNKKAEDAAKNYILFHSEYKDFEKMDFLVEYVDDVEEHVWGYDIFTWEFGSADDVVYINDIAYNKLYLYIKDSFSRNVTNLTNCWMFHKENGGRAFFNAKICKQPYTTKHSVTVSDLGETLKFNGNWIFQNGTFSYVASSSTGTSQAFSQVKEYEITNAEYEFIANWNDDFPKINSCKTSLYAKKPEVSSPGTAYVLVCSDTNSGFLTKDYVQHQYIEPVYTYRIEGELLGEDFHFIDKSLTISPESQEKTISFYWDGLLSDLTIYRTSGFETVSDIILPTEQSSNFIYTLGLKFGENSGNTVKNYSVTIAKQSDNNIRDTFTASQQFVQIPEVNWIQNEYTGISYDSTTQEIKFEYLGDNSPYEDLQLYTDSAFIQLPELPNTKTADGIYTLSINIGKNTSLEEKVCFIGISHKDYYDLTYTQTKLVQEPKPETVLTLTPDVFNVNNGVSIITVKLKYNDFAETTPYDGLNISSNLDLEDYELPKSLTSSREYNLSLTVPANNTESERNFYFTVTTKDSKYSATAYIQQKAAQIKRLYFVPDNISNISATQNTVQVQLYYNGSSSPYNDLTITSSWGGTISLPNIITSDGFYNLVINIGNNTTNAPRTLTVDVKTNDNLLTNRLYIQQNAVIRPATVFYWERSSYSIEFYETYIEATLYYNDYANGIPFDKLTIAPGTTFSNFSLPTKYNSDNLYKIRFNIGPNIDYTVKSYAVILEDIETGQRESVMLSIGAKETPQLFWVPDSLTVEKDQEDIQVNYYWNNYSAGDPSHYLLMNSDIPDFVPYLPETVSQNNNYSFNVHLGENNKLAPRNFVITLRTADRTQTATLNIMQYGTGGEADFTYKFEKPSITVPGDGISSGTYVSNKLIGSLSSLTGEYDIISLPNWVKRENVKFDKASGLLIIDKADKNVFTKRSGAVQILFYSTDGKSHATEFTLIQEAGSIDATNIIPIWRDTFASIDADYNYFRFTNKDTEEIYFNGQTIPGEESTVKINNIISDYLYVFGNLGKSLQDGQNITTDPVNISVSCSTDGSNFSYVLPETYKFIWDYSYDKNVPNILFNGNIIDYYDPRQKMIISSSNRSTNEMITKVEVYFNNSQKSTLEEYTLLPGQMHGSFVPAYSGPGDGAVKVKVSCTVQEQTEVREFIPKCTKADYVLHYVNRYGQICWMLFAGKQIKTDKITSSKYVQSFDNNYAYNFENVVYQNKIEESWTLTTSYLTDKQSEELTDLYRSPVVFLEDLNANNNDNIIAVTVETKTVDYKNFKNQGKFFTHTIKVQNAQNKFSLL